MHLSLSHLTDPCQIWCVLSFILSNLYTITFNCCLCMFAGCTLKFTDFLGINLVKVLTHFFFVLLVTPFSCFFSPHKRTLHLCKQRLAGWEREYHIPLSFEYCILSEKRVNHDETPPTSIQSFHFISLAARPSRQQCSAASWFCYCHFFFRQAFQDSITSQRRRFCRWRRSRNQQRIHRLWYG